jgi:hypothetical protein
MSKKGRIINVAESIAYKKHDCSNDCCRIEGDTIFVTLDVDVRFKRNAAVMARNSIHRFVLGLRAGTMCAK